MTTNSKLILEDLPSMDINFVLENEFVLKKKVNLYNKLYLKKENKTLKYKWRNFDIKKNDFRSKTSTCRLLKNESSIYKLNNNCFFNFLLIFLLIFAFTFFLIIIYIVVSNILTIITCQF